MKFKTLIYIFGLVFGVCQNTFASNPSEGVYPLNVNDCRLMYQNDVITNKNPVRCSRLKKVLFPYVNFDGENHQGELIVFDAIAKHTYNAFKELYEKKIPINKAIRMDNYHGDDILSQDDNNTSGFNGRFIAGQSVWSKHAYGVAIDINPLQNPFLGLNDEDEFFSVTPKASAITYVNRDDNRPGRPGREGMAENFVDIFYNNGFLIWGGEWNAPIDYQHFEIGTRSFVEELTQMPPENAEKTFDKYVDDFRECIKKSPIKDPKLARNDCIVKVKR